MISHCLLKKIHCKCLIFYLGWGGKNKSRWPPGSQPRFTDINTRPERLGTICTCTLWYKLTWKLEEDLARPTLPTLQSLPSHTTALFSTVGASSCTPPWANSYRPFKQKNRDIRRYWATANNNLPHLFLWTSCFSIDKKSSFLIRQRIGWYSPAAVTMGQNIHITGGFRYDFTWSQARLPVFISRDKNATVESLKKVTVRKGF